MTAPDSTLKSTVKEKYGQAALRVGEGATAAPCCGSSACCGATTEAWDPITSDLYDEKQKAGIPVEAVLASLGWGNPTALAALNEGETVLALAAGGGIDVLLSAKRVGPTGKAYGLDMTDEMLALANENKRRAGIENIEFLKGEIEHIPLPDNSVDVIISNCVINLSADKDRVLREAFRVLKPGGRFAVSDVVTSGEMLPEIRQNVLLWVGCVAGALEQNEYRSKLASAGFEQIDLEPTRVYRVEDAPRVPGWPERRCRCNRTASGGQVHECIRASRKAILLCGPACCNCMPVTSRAKVGMSLPGPTLLNLDFVFTVCDSAAGEVCPVWPGQPMTAHWGVPDPTTAQGTREQVEEVFRDAFFMLDRRISLFLCLPLAALDRLIQKEIAIKHGLSTKETSVTACW